MVNELNTSEGFANFFRNEFDYYIERLNDPSPSIRAYSVIGLSNLRDTRVFNIMLKHLEDPNSNVSGHAILALGRIGQFEAIEPLLQLLHKLPKEEKSWDIISKKSLIIYVLGQLGTKNEKVEEVLLYFLGNDKENAKVARGETIKSRTATALAQIGSTNSIIPLMNTLKDTEYDTKLAVIKALGKLKATEALPILEIMYAQAQELITIEDIDILNKYVISDYLNIEDKFGDNALWEANNALREIFAGDLYQEIFKALGEAIITIKGKGLEVPS